MVSRTAKNSQRSRRGSPAAATASGGPPDLSAAEVGDKIEVQHTDQRWYPAKVIAKRSVANAATQLRYRYDGHRKTNPRKWISRAFSTLKVSRGACLKEGHSGWAAAAPARDGTCGLPGRIRHGRERVSEPSPQLTLLFCLQRVQRHQEVMAPPHRQLTWFPLGRMGCIINPPV